MATAFSEKIRIRLSDSIETALKWGEGRLLVLHQPGGAASTKWDETLHSNRNYSPVTGKSFDKLTPKHFSFNAPIGACPRCHGLGQKMVFDEALIVPDQEKSLEQGAVLPWRRGGKRMITYYKALLRGIVQHYEQSMETPYRALPDEFKRALPDARIINLETSITRSSAYIPKGINYRMSPENAGCLAATAACLATTTCSIGDVPDYATPWRLSSTCGSRPLGQAVMPPRRARRRYWKPPRRSAYWYFRLPQREVAPHQIGRQRAILPA